MLHVRVFELHSILRWTGCHIAVKIYEIVALILMMPFVFFYSLEMVNCGFVVGLHNFSLQFWCLRKIANNQKEHTQEYKEKQKNKK